MASLRDEWKLSKGAAELKFKQEHPLPKDVHVNPPTPYPMKFKEDLGPTLDLFEKAKTPADKLKHANKAKTVIRSYREAIKKEKEMKGAGAVLLHSLEKIEKALG